MKASSDAAKLPWFCFVLFFWFLIIMLFLVSFLFSFPFFFFSYFHKDRPHRELEDDAEVGRQHGNDVRQGHQAHRQHHVPHQRISEDPQPQDPT